MTGPAFDNPLALRTLEAGTRWRRARQLWDWDDRVPGDPKLIEMTRPSYTFGRVREVYQGA